MELVAELVDSPRLLQESQHDSNLGILPPLFQDVMIRNAGILEQILQDILLLDKHLHLMAVFLQGRDGILVVMEMGRMAEIDKYSHEISVL